MFTLQQVASIRFRTSLEADRITTALMSNLALSTKANMARLAIGRSLAFGPFSDEHVDAKGSEIPASILFTQEDMAAWVGLIVTHSRTTSTPIRSMDDFRAAVRRHWHRGAKLLHEDWLTTGESYDRFLETLIVRRADLPDVTPRAGKPDMSNPAPELDEDMSEQLIAAMADIGVNGEVRDSFSGPRVTRYKVYLPEINQFDKLRRGLERLALSLSLQKSMPSISRGDESKTVFIDVPRTRESWVYSGLEQFREWVGSIKNNGGLGVYPGVDVNGAPYSFDLAAAPHLLVGGTTGSGKSVCLHALILSLISAKNPRDLQLALIDPKQVEFSVYKDSSYLYKGRVANDAKSAREMLVSLVNEMESRYKSFSDYQVSNIAEAHRKGMKMPYIVIFIEELADLLFMDKDLEDLIVRIAQKARASGLHLVLATQRPDAKTFSGLVRSNVPARIALTVQKSTESNIILDEIGAEALLGYGDMLVKARPGGDPDRVHGVKLDRDDVQAFLRDMNH